MTPGDRNSEGDLKCSQNHSGWTSAVNSKLVLNRALQELGLLKEWNELDHKFDDKCTLENELLEQSSYILFSDIELC